MEEKVIKIKIPEGYEIDKERSTFEKIVFKSKKENYDSICKKLFLNKLGYFCNRSGRIQSITLNYCGYKDINNCTSEKQAKKLLAINQLMNVAKYLNRDWKPNWKDASEGKFCIFLDYKYNTIRIYCAHMLSESIVHFKTEELAQKAIDILGEETIKLALSTDW